MEPSLTFEPQIKSSQWSNCYIKIAYMMVSQALKIKEDEDYLAPPPSYQLLNIDAGASLKVKQQKLNLAISITNALNSNYRSYLNRYRYFANELGTNISLHIKIPINLYP
jgi:iron complex outermembrane receptor protein